MGGRNSGKWERYWKKNTVEESRSFKMSDFHCFLYRDCNGAYSATVGRFEFSGTFVVKWNPSTPIVEFRYGWKGDKSVETRFRLQSTPTNFDGIRWWFVCPLSTNGIPCNRRVSALYLPHGARFFGCRTCHNLTYQSSRDRQAEKREYLRELLENINRLMESRKDLFPSKAK